MNSESDWLEEADKMIEFQGEMKTNPDLSDSERLPLSNVLAGSGRYTGFRAPQPLEAILEQIKQTLQSLPPPTSSPPSILTTWKFLKSLHSADIHKIVNIVDQLSPQALLSKVREIEQLAHRLDVDQSHQFLLAEEMHLLRK